MATDPGTTEVMEGYDRPRMNGGDARMPIPGNAEFLYVFGAILLLAIVAGISEDVDETHWFIAFVALSIAYLLSRGIAKASRVLEH